MSIWTIVSCMMRTCLTNKEWAMAYAVWPSGKIGPCVQREPTGRAIIVIVIERVIEREEKEKRDEKLQRKRETYERRETHEEKSETQEERRCEKRGRARERLRSKRSSVHVKDVPVFTFKTPVSQRTRAF